MLICEFSSLRLLFVRGQGGPGLVWRNKRRHQPLLPRLNETFIETIPQSRLLAEIRCSADGNSCQMYWDDGEEVAVSSEQRRSSDTRQDTSNGWACVWKIMRGKITDGCFYWIWFHGSCDFQSFRSSSRSRSVHASKHKQKHSNVCIGLFLSGKRCDGFTCHEVVTLCSQHRTCK